MEASPSCDCVLHPYFISPSADPEQLLFFDGSFIFFFLFLLLLIFSPHINYTDALGAMCFATSQRKPQACRSEEQPDVPAWQSTTRGSQLRMGTSPAPTNTGEITAVQTHSSFWGSVFLMFRIFFFFFLLVDVITAMIL